MVDARCFVALALISTLAGCASSGSSSLARHFVQQGTPMTDLGGTMPQVPGSATARTRASSRSYAIVDGISRSGGMSSSLEATDPALRDAMLGVRLSPSPGAHLAAALAYQRAGITDQAFDHLKQTLVLDPSNSQAYDSLARLWRDWGRLEEAMADANRAVYYGPESAAARNTLGTILFAAGHATAAERAFRKALELDPNAAYAARNLCDVVMRAGRTLEAIPLCRQASALQERPR